MNGGIGTYTFNLLNELSKFVDEIDLYVFSSPRNFNNAYAKKLPPNVKLKLNENGSLHLLFKLMVSIGKFRRYDILHINYASFFPFALFVKLIWHIPYIYVCHGCPQPEYEKGLSKLYYYIEAFSVMPISKWASRCINISNYGKNLLFNRHKVLSEVIYHGISGEFHETNRIARDSIREKLCIESTDYLVLFVGKFSRYKNILTLLDSIPYVIANRNDVKFLLIGEGELYDEIIDTIKNIGVAEYVIIKSNVEQICNYYLASDLFVLPSYTETFGLVLLEAMASKVPVIASCGGACPEVLGDSGLLFDPKDSEELACCILKLITNKQLYEQMQLRGLQRAKQFSWKKAAKHYLNIYYLVTLDNLTKNEWKNRH